METTSLYLAVTAQGSQKLPNCRTRAIKLLERPAQLPPTLNLPPILAARGNGTAGQLLPPATRVALAWRGVPGVALCHEHMECDQAWITTTPQARLPARRAGPPTVSRHEVSTVSGCGRPWHLPWRQHLVVTAARTWTTKKDGSIYW